MGEIKRFLASCHLLHDYLRLKEDKRPLSEYRNSIPLEYSLSLIDESTVSNIENALPPIENVEMKGSFPLIEALFEKSV